MAASAQRAVEDRLLELLGGVREVGAQPEQAKAWIDHREALSASSSGKGSWKTAKWKWRSPNRSNRLLRSLGAGDGGDRRPSWGHDAWFRCDKDPEKRMRLAEARHILQREEEDRRIDGEDIVREAIRRVEASGILFIDELDKIAAGFTTGSGGPDVSRQGVQRAICFPLSRARSSRPNMVRCARITSCSLPPELFTRSKPPI